jgi:hypothetical protein
MVYYLELKVFLRNNLISNVPEFDFCSILFLLCFSRRLKSFYYLTYRQGLFRRRSMDLIHHLEDFQLFQSIFYSPCKVIS